MDIELLTLYGLVILLAPLAGAVTAGALGPVALRGQSHFAPMLGVGAALVAAIFLFFEVNSAQGHNVSALIPIYDWITVGTNTTFRVEFLIDPLTSVMLLTVTSVALLVVIYARDYMRDHGEPERGYERFHAYLALFVFAMCALVLGGNFLLLYLGWEAVGLCSYLLIGFYYQKPEAAAAAKKAFLVNRVGDFGFGLAILLIYLTFNSIEYGVVFDMIKQGVAAGGEAIPEGRLTLISLLLLCGACGKSAQLPLHVWLPDAMEGPSPVSALIHAATMVTAGIFMIARCGAIFASSETAMTVIAVIGATTSIFAATVALVQTDMKRVLAYSTISQLGYMFLGIGVYAADAAVFHLFTHAFFKALLFLGAGSVMHGMGGIIDMREFSGLRKIMPWTFLTFFIGSLALAGFPFLSGFFSKDEIIHHALSANTLLGVIGLVTALLTAFYTFRMVFMAFFGEEKIPAGVHAHESGSWMLLPLMILCVGAVGAGYLGIEATGKSFHHFLEPVFADTFGAHHGAHGHGHGHDHGHGHVEGHGHADAHGHHAGGGFWATYGLMVLSGGLSIFGILAAYFIYVQRPWIAGYVKNGSLAAHRTLWNKYYIDELYQSVIIEPSRRLGRLAVGLDNYLIDGLIWLITAIPRGFSLVLQVLQGGRLQGYAVSMLAGVAVLVIWVFTS